MTAAISAASTSFSAACWRMMSSWRSGRVSSWIALSTLPKATSDDPTTSPTTTAPAPSASAGGAEPRFFIPAASSISADSARSRSSTEPSFSTTWSARSAFSSWVSWRASRSSTRAWPRAAARSAPHLLGGDDRDGRVEDVVAAALEQQRHLDHGDLGLGRQRGDQAAVRSPTRGWICASSQVSCSGSAKTISPIRARSTPPAAATSGPQRSTRRPRSGSDSSSSWTTASLESVAAPSRPKAASASDLPAAIPPVRPIVSGATAAAQPCSDSPSARRRRPQPRRASSGESGPLGDRFALVRLARASSLLGRLAVLGSLGLGLAAASSRGASASATAPRRAPRAARPRGGSSAAASASAGLLGAQLPPAAGLPPRRLGEQRLLGRDAPRGAASDPAALGGLRSARRGPASACSAPRPA